MKSELKSKASELRKEGWSIGAIAKELGLAKSTTSMWLSGIQVTLMKGMSAPEQWSLRAANKRSEWRKEGYDKAEHDEQFRLICALFWGEGSRTTNNMFGISNSDKSMVGFIYNWLKNEGYSARASLMIQHHGNLNDKEVKESWLAVAPVAKCWVSQNITKTSKKKRGMATPYGTACIRVHDTRLAMMMAGGVDWLRQMNTVGEQVR